MKSLGRKVKGRMVPRRRQERQRRNKGKKKKPKVRAMQILKLCFCFYGASVWAEASPSNMLFLEIEQNENDKEKRGKKPKKKDNAKDTEDSQKTKKTTKKDHKRNFHFATSYYSCNCCCYTRQSQLASDACREEPGGFNSQNRARFWDEKPGEGWTRGQWPGERRQVQKSTHPVTTEEKTTWHMSAIIFLDAFYIFLCVWWHHEKLCVCMCVRVCWPQRGAK